MEVIITVDISHEFVLQHTHDNIICTSEMARPSEQLGTVNAVTFYWPTPHQGKGDL